MSQLGTIPALIISILIIALSAFFVAVEFAVIGARRWRLAAAAETGPVGRAALRNTRELSLVLAGSQLGITLCLVALGAITKPAVHHLFAPPIAAIGLPEATADVLAFCLALVVVTFLHLVVGEMAPKSWAISHPERSALALAIPMRAFIWLTRPMLVALNAAANWCLRRIGVTPIDELSAGHGPAELGELIDHSAAVGALDEDRHHRLITALDAHSTPIGSLITPLAAVDSVGPDANAAAIKAAARRGGHSRLLVRRDGDLLGVVHVRSALSHPHATAADLMAPDVLVLDAGTDIHQAVERLRTNPVPYAVVRADGPPLGIITMHDLMTALLTPEVDHGD